MLTDSMVFFLEGFPYRSLSLKGDRPLPLKGYRYLSPEGSGPAPLAGYK